MQKENVEYVGFWRRSLAAVIDSALVLVVSSPLLIFASGVWAYDQVEFFLSYVFPMVMVIAFWTWKQATPGKIALSARIVDAKTGFEPFVWQLIIRYLGYYVSIIPLFMGILWIAFDKRKQGWHDKLARTVVVRTKGG
jgi:uncharacterized RDD family membrane protein YckC